MAKSTQVSKASSAKASKGSFPYAPIFVAMLALGGAYLYADSARTLNRFSEAVTERLCEMLPTAKNVGQDEEAAGGKTSVPQGKVLTRSSSYNPKLAGGKSYNAKEAMDARYFKLQEVCNRNADVMTPQSYAQKHMPTPDSFLLHTASHIAFCNLQGIGSKSYEALFMRTRGHEAADTLERSGWEENFANLNRKYKKAIMVRHPMERLISVYRKHFAGTFNPATGEVEEDVISFPDFIHLVVNGPFELAEFLEQNRLQGESLGIDTGMVDAKGKSQAWDSYWHRCGLCHPDFRPHFILHFDHAAADKAVLVEMMGNPEEAQKWTEIHHEGVAGTEEAIAHFYGQLTKDEIRGIYRKYQMDFELFGYDPEYFIRFGQDEE